MEYTNELTIWFLLLYRPDSSNFLRPRRMPLGSVDSEDGNALADDELHTLLPGTREISADDLSQVIEICFLLYFVNDLIERNSINVKFEFH